MTPTNELRFVERTKTELANAWQGGPVYITRTERVLQQRWATSYLSRADQYGHTQHSLGEPTEWRDVPLESEE